MIKEFFENNFEKYPKAFLVAVSGGVDSMALTFMLHEFCLENGIDLTAVTVDHKMRESSAAEALAVSEALKKANIKHEILTVEDVPVSNIEASLRDSRYDLLCTFALQNNIGHIFTAHHKNDLAENFLIRLFRGSQLDGLSGMNEVTDFKSVKICRPLLEATKKELIDYLEKRNIAWLEDESNEDDRFLRNKIRNFLETFEEKDLIAKRITRFTEVLKGSKEFQNEEVLKEAREIVTFDNKGSFIINLAKYRQINRKIALKILSLVLAEASQKGYKPRFEGLKRFEEDVLNLEKSKKRDFYGCQAKILTKSNSSEVLKGINGDRKWEIIENLNDFLWIYPMDEAQGEFYFRTILKKLSW